MNVGDRNVYNQKADGEVGITSYDTLIQDKNAIILAVVNIDPYKRSSIFKIEAGKADNCSGITTMVLAFAISIQSSKLYISKTIGDREPITSLSENSNVSKAHSTKSKKLL